MAEKMAGADEQNSLERGSIRERVTYQKILDRKLMKTGFLGRVVRSDVE